MKSSSQVTILKHHHLDNNIDVFQVNSLSININQPNAPKNNVQHFYVKYFPIVFASSANEYVQQGASTSFVEKIYTSLAKKSHSRRPEASKEKGRSQNKLKRKTKDS